MIHTSPVAIATKKAIAQAKHNDLANQANELADEADQLKASIKKIDLLAKQ